MNDPYFSKPPRPIGDLYRGGEQYIYLFAYCGVFYTQGLVYPKVFSDPAYQSVNDLHHHHADGH
jgi:hypothetical protein